MLSFGNYHDLVVLKAFSLLGLQMPNDVLEKVPLASLFLENHAATFMLALHRANKIAGRHQLLWCPHSPKHGSAHGDHHQKV